MADHRNFGSNMRPAAQAPQQSPAARRAALAVVQDISLNLDTDVLLKLNDAALSPRPEDCKAAIHAAVAQGTRPEDLADFYIPALAREMGERWCVDKLSFAGVTIGVSRLQAMLRELDPHWASDDASGPEAPSLLLVVPQEIYHTLGAIVLSGQLRRKGISVKLVLGGKPKDIAERVLRTKYHAVFISSSQDVALESLRRIVAAVKTATKTPPPIVVGGSILEIETADSVTALTGADFATQIPDKALRLCGLKPTTHNDARVKHRI
jgi:methanogenic corrinoid protein MtbC1